MNQKSFTGLNQEPRSSQKLEKSRAVLPPSHLIGRVRAISEDSTDCLLLGSKADSTTLIYMFHSVFRKVCRKTEVSTMDTTFYIEEGAEVAPPAWMKPVNKYGSVPGLEDEELASPAELERAYFQELWGPILLLPKPKSARFYPAWDCDSELGYNAFATVDFDRMVPEFDKARYKRDKLWEQVKDLMIMMKIVSGRIKDVRKYKILRLVAKGVLDADDIKHWDLWQVATMLRRALRIRKEIDRLEAYSRKKQQQASEKWLEGLG